jgi:hypothetical protein
MPSAAGSRVRGHLDPHGRPIRAPQPQKVIRDRAVAPEPLDEPVACLRIDEPLKLERTCVFLRRFRRVLNMSFRKGFAESVRALVSETVPM